MTILIAGALANSRVEMDGLSIRDVLNDAPNTASLVVKTTAPTDGQDVRILINSDTPRLLFNGTLQTTDMTYLGKATQTAFPCAAIDDISRLNERRPFGTWTDTSVTTIAQSIIATYAPGFTATHVQASLPTVSITFDGTEEFSRCLGRLATAIGGYFYVEDLDLHLFQTESSAIPTLPDAPTVTQITGSGIEFGAHGWAYTWVTAVGETRPSGTRMFDLELEESVTTLTTTSTGTQNDFNPGTLGTLNVLRCNNATLLTITGLTPGSDGAMVWVESVGAGQVDLANQAAGSTAADRIINNVTGTISLAPGSGRALLCYDATTARWRVLEHEQGAWIAVPYTAGDFTVAAGTWTVDVGDLILFRYWLNERTLTVTVHIDTSTVSTGGNAKLKVKVPGGFLVAQDEHGPAGYADPNTGFEPTHFQVATADSANIGFVRELLTTWPTGTNNVYLYTTVTFEVQ